MAATIPRCSAKNSQRDMSEALAESGCLVVTDVADVATREAVTRELAPHMEEAEFKTVEDSEDFYPGRTRRVTALARKLRAG